MASADERLEDAAAFAAAAIDQDAALVFCCFVDAAGVNRAKAIPVRRLREVAVRGLGISRSLVVYTAHDDVVALPGLDPAIGDIRLVPDPAAAVLLPGTPPRGWCPVRQADGLGRPLPTCARSVLEQVTRRAADDALSVTMAFEIEFTLLRPDGEVAHAGPAYGSRPLIGHDLAEAFMNAFAVAGLDPEQMHAEYAAGQYEVSVAPCSPLTAADRYVAGRWLIAEIAAAHGLAASFAPVTRRGSVGNGAHLHVSVKRDGRPLLAAGESAEPTDADGRAFVAGVLQALPALMVVYAPSVPSYWRLAPGKWSGASAAWGPGNREAALRYVPGLGESANLEVKVIDGAANPYLAAASVLASGLAGMREGLTLPPGLTSDPARLTPHERDEAGVTDLPGDLAEAIAVAEATGRLADLLGTDLADVILGVRERDAARDSTMTAETVIAEHLLRYG